MKKDFLDLRMASIKQFLDICLSNWSNRGTDFIGAGKQFQWEE